MCASFDHCGHLLQRSRVREHQEYGLVPVYTFSTTLATVCEALRVLQAGAVTKVRTENSTESIHSSAHKDGN